MWNGFKFALQTDFPPERLLQINSCGTEHVLIHDYTILRPKGRSDYHMLYLTEGSLDAEVGTVPVHIEAGQCVIYLPKVRQKYTFSSAGNPVSYYAHFTGEYCREALSYLERRKNMLYTIDNRSTFENLFRKLIQKHNLKADGYILEENGLLLQILSMIIQSCSAKSTTNRYDAFYSVAEYISDHYQENIDMKKCAEKFFLSYSRFAHLFSDTIGMSPHKYLLRTRLNHAQAMLRDTCMDIGEIAENVGFSDPLYFSRLFRQYIGVSPSEYRKQARKS